MQPKTRLGYRLKFLFQPSLLNMLKSENYAVCNFQDNHPHSFLMTVLQSHNKELRVMILTWLVVRNPKRRG